MKVAVVSMKEVLEAGVHFWTSNPSMESQDGDIYFYREKRYLYC